MNAKIIRSFDFVSGGDVWVLAIKNATVRDAGMYKCEVNTQPPIQTFHRLTSELPTCNACHACYVFHVPIGVA